MIFLSINEHRITKRKTEILSVSSAFPFFLSAFFMNFRRVFHSCQTRLMERTPSAQPKGHAAGPCSAHKHPTDTHRFCLVIVLFCVWQIAAFFFLLFFFLTILPDLIEYRGSVIQSWTFNSGCLCTFVPFFYGGILSGCLVSWQRDIRGPLMTAVRSPEFLITTASPTNPP